MNSLRLFMAFTAVGACVLAVAGGASSAVPAPPFHQCPAIGASPSCGILIEFTDSGINVLKDPSVPPYDANEAPPGEDTLIGVQNDSSATVGRVTLSCVGTSGFPVFQFDADGICLPV